MQVRLRRKESRRCGRNWQVIQDHSEKLICMQYRMTQTYPEVKAALHRSRTRTHPRRNRKPSSGTRPFPDERDQDIG